MHIYVHVYAYIHILIYILYTQRESERERERVPPHTHSRNNGHFGVPRFQGDTFRMRHKPPPKTHVLRPWPLRRVPVVGRHHHTIHVQLPDECGAPQLRKHGLPLRLRLRLHPRLRPCVRVGLGVGVGVGVGVETQPEEAQEQALVGDLKGNEPLAPATGRVLSRHQMQVLQVRRQVLDLAAADAPV